MEQQAFILRMRPSGTDRVPQALCENQITIGWGDAGRSLLDKQLSWEEFRTIISKRYYPHEKTLRKAGSAAGHMWRFIREMTEGDLVVVPYGSEFYVAEVSGPADYGPSKGEDIAYWRKVDWRNHKQAIPRRTARSALISRMKSQGTCVCASDVLVEIEECIEIAGSRSEPSFQTDLQARLIHETLDEIRSGRMDSFGFERLIRDVLEGLGAENARVIPRNQDKGADIVATFRVAGAFRQVVAVQAKHWQPDPPVKEDVVEQLMRGIEAESAHLGMVITSGTVSEDAFAAAEQFFEESGVRIELIDGEQFAKLIVEHGIG